jgi:hypothetical protein
LNDAPFSFLLAIVWDAAFAERRATLLVLSLQAIEMLAELRKTSGIIIQASTGWLAPFR